MGHSRIQCCVSCFSFFCFSGLQCRGRRGSGRVGRQGAYCRKVDYWQGGWWGRRDLVGSCCGSAAISSVRSVVRYARGRGEHVSAVLNLVVGDLLQLVVVWPRRVLFVRGGWRWFSVGVAGGFQGGSQEGEEGVEQRG